MAEPSAHEPKLKALAAYREGKLGRMPRAAVERHLATCAVCREALVGLRRFAALARAARGAATPEIDWARMELPLQREAVQLRRARRWRRAVLPALAVAAACLLVVLASRERESRPVVAVPRAVPAVREVAPLLSLRIAAIVGQAHAIDAAGRRVPVNLDTRPGEGWTLHTEPGSELHLVLEGTAAVLLAGDSQLGLGRAREGAVELDLARGRVVNAVRKLGASARYTIAALGYEVAVRGTHFSVEHDRQGLLGVQVDEGSVAVLRDGALVAELVAPQHWSQAGGVAPSTGGALARPREPLQGFEAWPALIVPVWARVVSWEIDGTRIGAAGELAMRVPAGDLDLTALLADGRTMRASVRVDPIGTRFDPRALRMIEAQGDRAPEAAPDAGLAAAVIRAGLPDLQRCYQRSLRNQAGGALSARLQLRIDPRGRVREAKVSASAELPPMLTDCIRAVATRWSFPAPGGAGITFEAPIRFQPRH